MDSDIRLMILLVILLAGYLAVIRLVLWNLMRPAVRYTLLTLAIFGGAWSLLNIIVKGDKTFWGWFFSDSAEFTVNAMLSSALLLTIALTALLNALRPRIPLASRIPWLLPVVFFLFLSLDEYYSYHETVESWRYLYAGSGLLLIAAAATLAIIEHDLRILLFVFLGAGLIGAGGVLLDAFANEVYLEAGGHTIKWFICRRPWYGIPCQNFGVVEETLELMGESLILAGFLSFAQRNHTRARWIKARRALAGAAALWLVWMVSSRWIVPGLEARLTAEPVSVEYLDGALSLEHYDLSREVASPGDSVDVTLYFQTGEFIHDNYYLSVHLLSQTDTESLAQADLLLGEWEYPTSAWIPGAIVKNVAHLTLPADLPAPASYWITVRVWGGPDLTPWIIKPPDYQVVSREIVITGTDRRWLSSDTVILTPLPVLGDPPATPPPTATGYRFANGMELYGYDLPADAQPGQALDLRLWWRTTEEINTDLTQYLHLVQQGGDGFFVLDQQGFSGTFPFADWPDGVDAVDHWAPILPAEMPAGTYRVLTGVYQTATVERIPVQDAAGQPVPDSSIELGTVIVH